MAQPQNPRRFYIDHGDDQPVVRAIPVRRPAPPLADPVQPVATHQASSFPTPEPGTRSLRARARRAPGTVSRLARSARRRSHLPRS